MAAGCVVVGGEAEVWMLLFTLELDLLYCVEILDVLQLRDARDWHWDPWQQLQIVHSVLLS